MRERHQSLRTQSVRTWMRSLGGLEYAPGMRRWRWLNRPRWPHFGSR